MDKAINEGTDAGQFAEQMLGYLRDLMATAVGGGPELLKVCNPTGYDALKQLADSWGLQTILAAVQLLDESLVRMRFSVQSQALFEVALIQISQLQDLATIARIIEAVQQGGQCQPSEACRAPRSFTDCSSGHPSYPEKKNDEGLNLSGLKATHQPFTRRPIARRRCPLHRRSLQLANLQAMHLQSPRRLLLRRLRTPRRMSGLAKPLHARSIQRP